jgi:hypothetical protein
LPGWQFSTTSKHANTDSNTHANPIANSNFDWDSHTITYVERYSFSNSDANPNSHRDENTNSISDANTNPHAHRN